MRSRKPGPLAPNSGLWWNEEQSVCTYRTLGLSLGLQGCKTHRAVHRVTVAEWYHRLQGFASHAPARPMQPGL